MICNRWKRRSALWSATTCRRAWVFAEESAGKAFCQEDEATTPVFSAREQCGQGMRLQGEQRSGQLRTLSCSAAESVRRHYENRFATCGARTITDDDMRLVLFLHDA